MTNFERERLQRYADDAGQWLSTMSHLLSHPETPQQAAAAYMTRAALELVAGIKQQIMIDTAKQAVFFCPK